MKKKIETMLRMNREKHLLPADKYGTRRLSVSSMLGKRIIDLDGYVSSEFGFDTPIFRVSNVILEDGTKLSLQGEHDIVYFPADDVAGLTNKDLLLAYDPEDLDEDDNDFELEIRRAIGEEDDE